MNTFRIIAIGSIFQVIFSLSLAVLVSCNETSREFPSGNDLKSMEDSVVTFNHQIVKSEIQDIDDFILRYHWEMKKTETGLRYMIYKKGEGPDAQKGDIVSVKYKINLLNGDLVFQSDTISLFTVEVGKREVVSGLEEGIMLMKKGGRAKLVVPSHLAFGLLGDMATIPARAALVFDVELCAIRRSKK